MKHMVSPALIFMKYTNAKPLHVDLSCILPKSGKKYEKYGQKFIYIPNEE
jgi:hypothetical protein